MTQQTMAHVQARGGETAWTTAMGTIRKGMRVIGAEGVWIGTVAALEGDEIMLESEGEGGEPEFVTLTQVDGVDESRVYLSSRGDATFGLGAEP